MGRAKWAPITCVAALSLASTAYAQHIPHHQPPPVAAPRVTPSNLAVADQYFDGSGSQPRFPALKA